MTKKLIILFVLLLVAAMLLTACGGTERNLQHLQTPAEPVAKNLPG